MLILIAGVFFLFSCGPSRVVVTEPAPDPVPEPAVSYQSFYDDLSPYGTWINYPGYGYVWMPDAGPDFKPYSTNGNWVYTDAGWTWASDYNWGWATFHYGRWFFEQGYGWMWVPGNEWAPAWVSWRGGGDYYGWAPLGPNVSIDVALGSYNPPANYWNFVPRRYMGNPGWHNYYVNDSRNVTIINNTTIINNYSGSNRARYAYAPGPDPREVSRVSGAEVRPVQIREANTPGSRVSGNQFNIYRPRVSEFPTGRNNASSQPVPARVRPFSELRPAGQNPGINARPANQSTVENPNRNADPRSSTEPSVRNPSNNNPGNSGQPAMQNQNARPAATVGNPVNNNPRPVSQPQNQNYNSNQHSSAQPAVMPGAVNASPANPNRQANGRSNPGPGVNQPVQQPQRTVAQPSPANRTQVQGRPAAGTQTTQARPVHQNQRVKPAPKPDQNKEKPKSKDEN